ncbi:CHASE3 domain-containing protein [Peristeroidobacter agariperforans]|uniref:CHASE3 domain-containing protein n=1 Tax=Peristeroidobacter agariperforans TaxID=268404 RepID=UPI00101C947B|nr:CHASE3 domain-containing protein [Peristeroidobacter agariperforans]
MRVGSAAFTGFGKRNAASVIASVGLLALVLWMAHLSLREVRATSELSDHTQEVRLALDAVSESMLKMETGQRGFLLTGREAYLEPYNTGAAALDGELQRLGRLIADDPQQTERLRGARELIAERRVQLRHALRLRQNSGMDAAIDFLQAGPGIATMNRVFSSLAAMSAEETRLLTRRKQQEQASLQRNFYLIVTLCAVAAALVLTMLLRVQREMAARAESVRRLDEVNASLAESTASKTRFLSAASHDLRQPLHSLSLLNAALRGQQLSAPALAIVEAQRDSLEAMSSLVNRLLNISMIESGVIQPYLEDVPLTGLLAALEMEFRPQARAKQLQLDIELSNEAARTDPTLLREIVQNLVENAIRYTNRGRVSVRARREADAVILEVADTGRGIPEDQLERIFEEFHQIRHGAEQARDGFGLGLSIVSRLTKLLDLPIGVSSRLGEGTTFTLKLVAAVSRLQPVKSKSFPAPVTPSIARSGRILLVDDEASVRDATALFLQMDGHEVKSAGSPEEALRVIEQWEQSPDVIVSDFQLNAALNGAELIEQLRQLRNFEIPAVVLSGDTMKVTPRCASIAACRVFHKPVDAEELSAHIRKLLDGVAA